MTKLLTAQSQFARQRHRNKLQTYLLNISFRWEELYQHIPHYTNLHSRIRIDRKATLRCIYTVVITRYIYFGWLVVK